MSTVILPAKLQGKTKKELMEYCANMVGYHQAKAEAYKWARQVVESGGDYRFENDVQYDKLFERPNIDSPSPPSA